MRQQKLATDCGHWPLYRYRPAAGGRVREEFVLDSQAPSIPVKTYAYNEIRYKMLSYTKPEDAKTLLRLAQDDIEGAGVFTRACRNGGRRRSREARAKPGSHVQGRGVAAVMAGLGSDTAGRGVQLGFGLQWAPEWIPPPGTWVRVEKPVRRVGIAAVGERRHDQAPGGSRRGCSRDVLALRGTDSSRPGSDGALHGIRTESVGEALSDLPEVAETTSGRRSIST